MTCREMLELVEPLATDDLVADADVREHLESCPGCAAALATARRIDSLLASRPAPEAPARFTAAVQQRIRSERWQEEQRVDRIFNVAIAVAVLLVVAAGLFFVNGRFVMESVGTVSTMLAAAGADMARSAAPSLGMYAAATGLLVSGLAMWWWAEG